MAGRGAAPRKDSDDDDELLSAYALPVGAGAKAAVAPPLPARPSLSAAADTAAAASLDEAPEDGPGDEDADEDALFAEKIKLLQEENARLRAAAAAAAATAQQDSLPTEAAPDASAASLTATATAMADWLVAAAKEREKAVYEAASAARAAERESAERSARETVLAQVDQWSDRAGQSLTARPRDGGATPASVAALRVHVPKPQALTDGASAVLARLESQFGASPAKANLTPGRVTAHREGAAKDRAASLTAAVDDLEKALARSAAVMAVTAAGGGRDVAGTVAQAARRWQALPPLVRRTSIVVLCCLFFLAVFVLDFYGSEEDQQEELLDRGVVFNVQAKMMEMTTLSALAQAGTDNAVQASQAVREAARGISAGGALRALLSPLWQNDDA